MAAGRGMPVSLAALVGAARSMGRVVAPNASPAGDLLN